MRNLLTNIILLAISAAVAWFLVNAFDSWYHDKEHRRAAKRQRKQGRYE